MSVKTFENVPNWVWEDLRYEIARAGLEYTDNFRAYSLSDDTHKEEFMKARRSGCCGSFETTVKLDNDRWVVGCNHGH